MGARPVSIVVIEDDEGHATIQRNIRRAGVNNGSFVPQRYRRPAPSSG